MMPEENGSQTRLSGIGRFIQTEDFDRETIHPDPVAAEEYVQWANAKEEPSG